MRSVARYSIWSKKTARTVCVPLTVGGGVRARQDVHDLLHAGADKVSINSAAVSNPELIAEVSAVYGSQAIVVAIDAKRVPGAEPLWHVYTHGGRHDTGLDAVAWAKQVATQGAGEILLTSMDRDGTGQGYDLELTRLVSEAVSVPVIASGGVGTVEHLLEGLTEGCANAALAASIFHDGHYTIEEVKNYLKERGVPIRLS